MGLGLRDRLVVDQQEGNANDIPPFNPAAVSETHEQSIWTGRGRLGLMWDRWLAYLTGGGAAGSAGIHTVSQVGITGEENRTIWGWTVGGGAETAFAHNWSIKGEFLYVDFGNPGFYNPPPNRVFSDRAGGIHLRDYIGRAGLNYKLDWGSPATSRY
jgi:outer membrane immunogenic protein